MIDWSEAACVGADPDLFFPASVDMGDEAKAFCQICPMRQQCLDFIRDIENSSERYGVWGGMTQTERTHEWDNVGHAQRQYCNKGHRLTEDNVVRYANGRRRCVTCKEAATKRTHCINGHPWNDVNVYLNPSGYAQCKLCHAERKRAVA